MATDRQAETTTARREVFAGRLLRVYVDDVTLPGGASSTREVVEHPGAVAIVATDGDGRILLVRQWRHPLARALWEIPAGTREPDEPVEATARRELEEETGYSAQHWQALGVAASSPGFSTEETHFFAARHLTEGTAHTDADENVEARLFTPAEIAALIAGGAVDTKTLAGLALAGFPVAAPA
jgi:ADP-ribose pyrophosphatase